MSFTERWYNTIVTVYDWIIRHTVYLPSERELVNKHFAHLAPLPPLDDIIRNVSMILINSHRAIAPARPSMPSIFYKIQIVFLSFSKKNSNLNPDVIPIGGAHIKPAKPLPNDLKKFLDEAKHGAIYFSLGSNLKSAHLPPQLIKTFLG